jgi:hypothetical protein
MSVRLAGWGNGKERPPPSYISIQSLDWLLQNTSSSEKDNACKEGYMSDVLQKDADSTV